MRAWCGPVNLCLTRVSEAKGYQGHKQNVFYFVRVAKGMLYHVAF